MTRRSRSPAKPHARKKAERRVLSPDQVWAAKIIRRMLLDCHPWQQDGAIDPARRVSFCVGRGGAKTTTKRVRGMIKLLWLRGQYIGYAATSKDHARELNWDPIKNLCEAYGIRSSGEDPDVSFSESKMTITCHRTGSIYRLRGVEDKKDAERFRGFPQAEFQVDECGSFPPELLAYLLDQCVAPRLGQALTLPPGLLEWLLELEEALEELAIPEEFLAEHRGGCIVLGSTPPAMLRGEFYEVTREGSDRHRPYALRDKPEFKDWKGYSSHFWQAQQVVNLPNAREKYPAIVANWEEALREKAEKRWGDDHPIWQREYMGIWSRDNTDHVFKYRPHADGKPWNQWDPLGYRSESDWVDGVPQLRRTLAALPKDLGEWHHVLTMDQGTRDPFACNVLSFAPRDPERRRIHTFGFERTGMHARTIAELVLGPEAVKRILAGDRGEPYDGLLGVLGWPDVTVIDADQTTIDEIANVYGLRCKKADRKADSKFGAIELVNGELVEGRMWIMKGSPLERQVSQLQWKPDDNGNPREDKAQANHSTDTLLYGNKEISVLFDSGTVEHQAPAKPGQIPGSPIYSDPMGLDRGDGSRDAEPASLESLLADPEFDDDASGLL